MLALSALLLIQSAGSAQTLSIPVVTMHAPDPIAMEHLSTFLQLRVLYVYLSRLVLFGDAPTAEQRETLAQLRALVLERVTWP